MFTVGTTDQDIQEILEKWDHDADSRLSWKEVLPSFLEIMHTLASDGRDHWVSLFVLTV